MALDFPNAPAVGDLYPAPPVAGLPSYRWDGSAWQLAGSGTLPLAPIDGKMYGSKDGAWQRSVAVSGDTLTGPLILNADPTNVLGAASKQYVDTGDAAAIATIGTRAVRYDAAQALNDTQQGQARSNIYAAPYDAVAFNGFTINPGLAVCQNSSDALGFSGAGNNYLCDFWRSTIINPSRTYSTWLYDLDTSLSAWGWAWNKQLLFQCGGGAGGAISSGEFLLFQQRIEQGRIRRLNWGTTLAQPVTVSFWYGGTRGGVLTVTLMNKANTRAYNAAVAVTGGSSNYYSVTIPGDTAAGWQQPDNDLGMFLMITALCGSANKAPTANVWGAGGWVAAPTQSDFFTANGDTFAISNVMMHPGIYAPPASKQPLLMRPFENELMLAKRQWEASYEYGVAPGTGTDIGTITGQADSASAIKNSFRFTVEKRAPPTMTLYSANVGGTGIQGVWTAPGAVATAAASAQNVNSKGWAYVLSSGLTTNGPFGGIWYYGHYVSNARL